MKRNNYKPLFAGLLALFFGFIGSTFAYFGTNNTFENQFNAGEYVINSTEYFESPTNWTPGDVTPKQISVTNEGEISAAVKVCFRQKWEDKNGNTLPIRDNNNEYAALLEFNQDYDLYWKEDCDNDIINKHCFYYFEELAPGDYTKPLLESVTYNSIFPMEGVNNCTEDPTTHTKTCTSTMNGYSGGKFTLYVDIQTVQYNLYNEAWNNPQVTNGNSCENLNIRSMRFYNNILKQDWRWSSNLYEILSSFESVRVLNNMNIPNNAINSFDVSLKKDGTVKAWYTDNDNNGKYELFIGANGKVIAPQDSEYLLSGFINVTEVDVSNLDTSNVTDMPYMFNNVGRNATSISITGLESWNTSNVTDMSEMFNNVGRNATTVNISNIENWDVSNVTKMIEMFANAGGTNLTIDFSNWDRSSIFADCGMFSETQFTHLGTSGYGGLQCPG